MTRRLSSRLEQSLAALLLAVSVAPAQAQPSAAPAPPPATPPPCTAATVSVRDFAAATTEAASGQCAALEAVAIGQLLIADVSARYRLERLENTPSSNGALLGLYHGGAFFDQPRRVRVIGRLVNCAAMGPGLDQSSAPGVPPVGGYCAQYHGQAIRIDTLADLGAARLSRLRPWEAEADMGNLAPMAQGDDRQRLEAAAQRFLLAVRNGDRAALAAMHGGGAGGRRSPVMVEDALALILDVADAPFRWLNSRGRIATEIFGWKPPLWADASWHEAVQRASTLDAIACFTDASDGAIPWPIDSKDADNLPARPYACTRIHIDGVGADARASFETAQARAGLIEP